MTDEPQASILVVDDSEAICKALRDALTVAGYAVRIAPSGERALQILETTTVDLVITDLKMSGISGIQLLKKIKEQSPALPVVILTGYGDMDSVIEAMRAGVADYLKKPFSFSEVLEITARELNRSRQVQAAARVITPMTASPASFAAPGEARTLTLSSREIEKVDSVLSELRAETMAEAALLVEETGCLISAKGMVNNADLPALSALVVAGRAANTQLASLLGEGGSFTLNYLEGQRVAVYTAGIGQGLFLVVIVPKTVKQGAVWVYAKKAASEIEKIVGNAVWASAKKAADPRKAAGDAPQQPASSAAPVSAGQRPESPPPPAETVTPIESLFTEQTLAEGAGLADSVQTLTFEEAMARGLLGDLGIR